MRSPLPRRLPDHRRAGATLAIVLAVLLPGCGDGPVGTTSDAVIDFDFPGASLGYATPAGDGVFRIGLKDDTNATTKDWFEFRVKDGAGEEVTFRLENVGSSNVWSYRQPAVSTDDGQSWTRITDTNVEVDTFVFSYTVRTDDDLVALGPAYSFARHLALVSELSMDADVASVSEIGASLGGEPLHRLEIRSQPAGTLPAIWAVARQHPGEPGGSYMIEGFLRWAVSDDAEAVALRQVAEIHAIPFMNPDGVLAGNQRVNLAGLDLNRQWENPTLTESPTVLHGQEAMTTFQDAGGETRVVLDFHSAPGGRANFFFYNDEATSSPPVHAEVTELLTEIQTVNPDFVALSGSVARPVDAARARGWGFTALDAQSITIESSGNDVTYGPFAGEQMTPERLLALGEAVGRGILRTLFQ